MKTRRTSRTTLPDIIESAFKVDFRKKEIERFNPSPDLLHDLALAVDDYYREFRICPKESWELRPYVRPYLTPSGQLGMDYVFGKGHFKGFTYAFDADAAGQLSQVAKRYLLYCHSLCIHDPLPYLLDYFLVDPCGDEALSRLPAVRHLLLEYAKLEVLIRKQFIVPLSGPTVGPREVVANEEEIEFLVSQVPPLSPDPVVNKGHLRIIADVIRDQQRTASKLEHHVDLFFPDPAYVSVLKGLLLFSQEAFTSAEVQEPFDAAVLGDVASVNPDAVSLDDIVRMREADELFAEWRQLLSRVFRQLYDRRGQYTDLEREFCDVARGELLSWKDRLKEQERKSPFLRRSLDYAQKALIGVTAGALGGLAVAGPPGAVVGGAVTGAMNPALELLRDFVTIARSRPRTLTLRHHFLALEAHNYNP